MTKSALAMAALVLAACTTPQLQAAGSGPEERYPDRAYKLTCGAETVQVHFTHPEAHFSNPDGSVAALKRLDGGPSTYTNGRVTLTRKGDGSQISFARGRRAMVDCTDFAAPPDEHQH